MNDSFEDYYADNTDDKRSIGYSVSYSTDRNKRYEYTDNDIKYNRKYQYDELENREAFSNKAREEKEKTNHKIINLERDREYLMMKNKDLEDNITRLERIINTQFNCTQPKEAFPSYTTPNYSLMKSSITSLPNKKASKNQRLSKQITSKSKSRSKQRASTPHKSLRVKSKTKALWSNEKEKEEKQARDLREKVSFLQKKVEELKEELKLNMLESKGESYLLYEVDKWQKRTEIIGKDYIENLALIKKKLFNDKIDYQTEIKKIQNICAFQIGKLKENCEGLMNKQNYTIEGYTKNNNEIRKRLDKMKNVFVK